MISIVALSDTHWTNSRLRKLKVPTGDILVHAGDATFRGKPSEWENFNEWFAALPHKHKVFVPGNHDFNYNERLPLTREIEGIKFGFMSEVPNLPDWAYHATEHFMQELLKAIGPVDVLVTHGPSNEVLDRVDDKKGKHHYGGYALRSYVLETAPKVHIHGHVHSSHGDKWFGKTHVYNVSICDEEYEMAYPVTVIEM